MYNPTQKYQTVNIQSEVLSANSHKLILLLLKGAIENLVLATASMKRVVANKEDYDALILKNKAISKCLNILNGLQASINPEVGGEISQNLEKLYDFLIAHIIQANIKNIVQNLEDAKYILEEIKTGWEQMPAAEIAKIELTRRSASNEGG